MQVDRPIATVIFVVPFTVAMCIVAIENESLLTPCFSVSLARIRASHDREDPDDR